MLVARNSIYHPAKLFQCSSDHWRTPGGNMTGDHWKSEQGWNWRLKERAAGHLHQSSGGQIIFLIDFYWSDHQNFDVNYGGNYA